MKVISNWKTSLSASITATQTTIPVSSIETTDDTPVTITTALIDSVGYMVIEPGSSKVEIIKFTGITSNGDGTGTLTGVTRGLAFSGATETNVAANAHAHQAGSTIILTNAHYYYDKLMDLDSDETVTGIKTFAGGATPIITDSPVSTTDAVNKAYVDATATGTAIIAAIVVPGIAGETVTAGQAVYFDSITNDKWMLTDANVSNKSTNVMVGIAQGAGSSGNTIVGGILLLGLDNNQSGMTIGDTMYLSDTAGEISATPGTNQVSVGIARSATKLYFDPHFDNQLTSGQKAALGGSSGVPSVSNKYITEADVSASGGSGKIIRATLTKIATGIFVPVEQLEHTESSQGALIYRNATKWTQIAAGVNNQFLKTQGPSANPIWTTIVTTKAVAVYNDNSELTTGSDPQTVFSTIVPGGTLGLNDYIKGTVMVTGAASKVIKITLNGNDAASCGIGTASIWLVNFFIGNRGSVSSQITSAFAVDTGGTVDTSSGTSAETENFASDVTLAVVATGASACTVHYVAFEVYKR